MPKTQPSLPHVIAVALPAVGGVCLYLAYAAYPASLLAGLAWTLGGLLAIVAGFLVVRRPSSVAAWLGNRAHALWRALNRWVIATTRADPLQPMSTWGVRLLAVYLMALGGGGVWTLVTLWSAGAEAPAEAPAPANVSGSGDPADMVPVLTLLTPDSVLEGVSTGTVRLWGRNFRPTSRVLVDGVHHGGGRYVGPTQMVLQLNDTDFQRAGSRFVSVQEGDAQSVAMPLVVLGEADVRVTWRPPFGPDQALTLDVRFMLLVLVLGGLGGVLASFNSLASYRGEGKLTRSWFLHYWVSPFVGAGVAFLLYALIRAGLLSGTSMELQDGVTPWGLVAISGLAGLFHDKTLLKLREVFVILFNPRDDRSGKIDAPPAGALIIKTKALPDATVGDAYTARLDATGGQHPYSWSVEPKLPPGLALDPLSGVISGTPTAKGTDVTYTFTLSDMTRTATEARLSLHVR